MKITPLTQNIFNGNVLKALRELMGKQMSHQKRLNKIVSIVAEYLHVNVCSLYVLRPGDLLELFATKGLDEKAIHETFLRVGEGLIGEVALQQKTLFFKNVWEHPSFVYKPETKEKAFKSLLGVPIIRGENLLGVLAIQTTHSQEFSEETTESMQTIAMVLAELLATYQLEAKENLIKVESRSKVDGVKLIAGVAVGQAVLHKHSERITDILAKNTDTELKKLKTALNAVTNDIQTLLNDPDIQTDQQDMLTSYLLFIQDKGWITKITKAIKTGLTAQAAVQRVGDETSERMGKLQDTYIKERIHDLKDVSNRLIRYLNGKNNTAKNIKLPKNTILVAHSMGPAELLDYDTEKIKAIVLEEGSQTMHVVIVARSLNIPVLGGINNIFSLINTEDELAVDATKGLLYINPSTEVLDEFDNKIQIQKRLTAQYQKLKKLPGVTLDGVPIALSVNAGLSTDLLMPEGTYFDGVGLYRTELPFMTSEQLPDVETQTDIYKRAILSLGNKPIIFRTLDIGSDKILPYFENTGEKNPAMGWRSIRITLDRRALLRGQLRAFIRATEGKELHIMFPMISSINELLEAKKTLQIELERERQKGGILPSVVKVGTMLEVPSLMFQLNELVKLVDFISIGTNDLAQFLFATDRGNPMIWDRYDSLSPAMLKALKYINDICKNAGVPCSICGEMASKPLEAMALVGLGFTSLSMTPAALGAIKAVVRSMNQKEVANYLKTQLSSSSATLRDKLQSYATDHNIFI